MNKSEEIPEPADSGSDGTQKEGEQSLELFEASQFDGENIVQAIQGLAATNTRVFGSEATSALIAGIASQSASDVRYFKGAAHQLQNKVDELSENLSTVKIDNAVLKERINSSRKIRHLRNLGIAIGTLLLSASIPLFDSSDYQNYGLGTLVVGAILILMGWFSPAHGGDK